MATRFDELQVQIRAVEFLRLMKELYSYQQLSEITGIPITVLNRYVKGHILPSLERAEELIERLERSYNITEHVLKKTKFTGEGFLDNTQLLSDTLLLRIAANHIVRLSAGRRVSKVLTVAVDGIPLAVHVANILDVPVIYAKKEKEVGVENFLEESFTVRRAGLRISLYLPKSLLDKRDSVLIVDDVVRSGEQLRALVNLVRKANAEIAGVFVMISFGDRWMKDLEVPPSCPVGTIVMLSESPEAT
ncbi:MAG: helix-turn-helix domain-containing protein [Candidatus Verstraetearchaeota archaeon]|nr:helix-turn-helix domain-containing protein [Candidatus Verstraetearchaeota archaeon]